MRLKIFQLKIILNRSQYETRERDRLAKYDVARNSMINIIIFTTSVLLMCTVSQRNLEDLRELTDHYRRQIRSKEKQMSNYANNLYRFRFMQQ